MFSQIMSLILQPIIAAYNWLMSFFTYDPKILGSWMSLVFIYTLIRILLSKFIAGGLFNRPIYENHYTNFYQRKNGEWKQVDVTMKNGKVVSRQ